MASYTQFHTQLTRGKRWRILWVCGDQRVLVDEVIHSMIKQTGAAPTGIDHLDLSGGDTPADVWDVVNQQGMDEAPHMVVVEDADQITDWQPLSDWIEGSRQRINQSVVLVLVSPANNFPFQKSDNPAKRPLQPHAEWINQYAAGMVVRCVMPNPTDTVAWLSRIRPMSEDTGLYLLSRAGEDLYEAANVCRKLAVFSGEITSRVVDAVCYSSVKSFENSLIFFRHADAMDAAQRIDHAEIGGILTRLDSTLEDLARLHALAKAKKTTTREKALEFGRRMAFIQALTPVAPKYDANRRAACRGMLAMVDEAYRRGVTVGLLETLVTGWTG